MKRSDGIHVFIFCCTEYRHLLDDGIASVKQNLLDPILSINVISNRNVSVPSDVKLILDQEFWSMLVDAGCYRDIYNQNWFKQQLFKLNLHKLVKGKILVVDAEVLYNKPIQYIDGDKQNLYVCDTDFYIGNSPWSKAVTFCIDHLLDINRTSEYSFITEAVVFSSDILEELHSTIETKHNKTLFDLVSILLRDVDSLKFDGFSGFSEYEIYGNYLLSKHPEQINEIIMYDNQYQIRTQPVTSITGGETTWLTFYQQVRGEEWPDCNSEDEFKDLPESVQKECIEIYGYVPKQ